MTTKEVLQALGTSENGLPRDEAEKGYSNMAPTRSPKMWLYPSG